MGCGCNKGRTASLPSSRALSADAASAAVARAGNVEYDVYDPSGALLASFTNPVTARAEARRTGGTAVPRRPITTGTTTTIEKEPSHG